MAKIITVRTTIVWGVALWFFGYLLGIVLFAFVPKEVIGWYIMPLGCAVTLWVLWRKIHEQSLPSYILIGFIWTTLAVVLDYVFLVRLFASTDYYKLDVFVYYATTFFLPVVVWWYKACRKR